MRYVRFQIAPIGKDLHPMEEAIAAEPDLERRAIHHFNVLNDDTAVTLVEFEGDADRAAELSEADPDILSYNISQSGSAVFSYSHFRPTEMTKQLYSVPRNHEIVVDMPIHYTEDGALEITAIGELANIRGSMVDLPEDIRLELVSTGEYTPSGGHLYERLTERQKETLRTAVEVGYYEEPRRVTYEDVAREMDLSAGTVGEHLRKIESKILTNVLPSSTDHRTTSATPS